MSEIDLSYYSVPFLKTILTKNMSKENTSSDLWSIIGKLGIIVALVWGAIQIYNYLFKTEDYQVEVAGSHSFYETSPVHNKAYKNAIEYKALVKAIIERDGNLKTFELDTLVSKVKKGKDHTLKSSFEYYKSEVSNQEGSDIFNFNEIWYFTIKNTGHKPLEELSLELPFEGSYKVKLPNDVSKVNSFKNKIEIGELRPSYEATITCWSNNYSFYSEENEEKSRFTHKYGWFSIKYPVQVTGLYAWNKKYDDFPLLLVGIILAISIFFFGAYTENRITQKKIDGEKLKEEEKQIQK